jgi:membrane-bound ClpP family serine protease
MSASNLGFLLFSGGICGVAFELLRPGFYVPGALGAGAVLAGLFVLCAHARQPGALAAAIAISTVLVILENWSPVGWVSGIMGTLVLAVAPAIWSNANAWLTVPIALTAGLAATSLLGRTRRARRTKIREAAR